MKLNIEELKRQADLLSNPKGLRVEGDNRKCAALFGVLAALPKLLDIFGRSEIRGREEYSGDPEKEWEELWKDIIAPNGEVDVAQLKLELCDFSMILRSFARVLDHATGGVISKQYATTEVVCSVIDDHVSELCADTQRETCEHLAEMVRGMAGSKWVSAEAAGEISDAITAFKEQK